MTERKTKQPIKLSHVLIGLSKAEITFLQEVVATGQLQDINNPMAKKIRAANLRVMSGANLGMQWKDFGRNVHAVIGPNPEYYRELRNSVLEAINDAFHPEKNFNRNKMFNQKDRGEFQSWIVKLRDTTAIACDCVALNPEQEEIMQNAVLFWQVFGIRKIPTRRI